MGGVAYHSSLAEPGAAKPRRRFTAGGSLAFVADISSGLHPAFAGCDLLYSEIAWEATFKRFAERAGSAGTTYDAYIAGVSKAIATAKAPLILVVGKRAIGRLPSAMSRTAVNLNSGGSFVAEAVALTYRCRFPAVRARHKSWQNVDTESLLRVLAASHFRVGDFSCGYGNTGRIFAEAGKEWVMSDLNPSCIGHIAEHARSWRRKS